MKLSYQLLKQLILEQLTANKEIAQLRDYFYDKDLAGAGEIWLNTENRETKQYFEDHLEKIINQNLVVKQLSEGPTDSDEDLVDYYQMDIYLGNDYLGAVQARSGLTYPDDPVIDSVAVPRHGHFLGNRDFRVEFDGDPEGHMASGDYRKYTEKRIKDYLKTPNGIKVLATFFKNK